MNLKLRYKENDKFSKPETDADIIIENKTYIEENRIFKSIDEETFKQIKLEFNSYLLPCNSGIYLSKYSSFDEDKLYKYRNYLMAKSNFNQKGKIDNYYKFFLLLHLMIKNKEIPTKENTTKLYLEKYLKVLNNKKYTKFNLTEMLSLNYYITQNFCVASNLKKNVDVLEYMTIRINNYKPLYRITDMNLYIKDRKNYISKVINEKYNYFFEKLIEYDLKAPGVKTGFLTEEKFVINHSMFYDFNIYMFNKKAKVRNLYYRNLFEEIRKSFIEDEYDFIPSGYYENKKGN